jgi:trimeric autotransporter adhesin
MRAAAVAASTGSPAPLASACASSRVCRARARSPACACASPSAHSSWARHRRDAAPEPYPPMADRPAVHCATAASCAKTRKAAAAADTVRSTITCGSPAGSAARRWWATSASRPGQVGSASSAAASSRCSARRRSASTLAAAASRSSACTNPQDGCWEDRRHRIPAATASATASVNRPGGSPATVARTSWSASSPATAATVTTSRASASSPASRSPTTRRTAALTGSSPGTAAASRVADQRTSCSTKNGLPPLARYNHAACLGVSLVPASAAACATIAASSSAPTGIDTPCPLSCSSSTAVVAWPPDPTGRWVVTTSSGLSGRLRQTTVANPSDAASASCTSSKITSSGRSAAAVRRTLTTARCSATRARSGSRAGAGRTSPAPASSGTRSTSQAMVAGWILVDTSVARAKEPRACCQSQ